VKIFFDMRWTRLDTLDGIGRYGSNLVAALHRLHPLTMLIYDVRQLKRLPPNIPYIVVNSPFNPVKELFLPRQLNRLGADVVYSPMQVMGTWRRRYKLIFTLHDMIYYHHHTPPTHLAPHVRLIWWLFHQAYWPQRWLLNKADYLITVSNTSKTALKQYHLTDRPIGVVYNASSLPLATPVAAPDKELVYMGSFMPYKNAETLVKTINLLPDYTLHLASRVTPVRRTELESLATNPKQLRFWDGINDKQYAKLLAGAAALVTASKDEGFGMPLLEAMHAGTPVICSDMPIFHEVAGAAAIFCDSSSPQDFADAVKQLEDQHTRQMFIIRGREQAKRFNWNDSAAALLAIMQQLTGK
jgi:glycosyltransferase involved in cell wall biosynthesis